MNDHTTDASPDNPCFLYIIAQERSNYIKIGVTTDIDVRLAQLQTGNPQRLIIVRLLLMKDFEAAIRLEKLFHQRYERLQVLGEWFHVSPIDLLSDLNFAIQIAKLTPDVISCSDFPNNSPREWCLLQFNNTPLWSGSADVRTASEMIQIVHSIWEEKKDGQE